MLEGHLSQRPRQEELGLGIDLIFLIYFNLWTTTHDKETEMTKRLCCNLTRTRH